MIGYAKGRILLLLEVDFIRFCIVGGTGFVINVILLAFFHSYLHIPILVSQLIAAEIALFSNFMLHHHWTYRKRNVSKTIRQLLILFHMTSWPAIIGSALMVSLGVKIFHLLELEALIISSLIVLGWNFFWSKFVLWKDVSDSSVKETLV